MNKKPIIIIGIAAGLAVIGAGTAVTTHLAHEHAITAQFDALTEQVVAANAAYIEARDDLEQRIAAERARAKDVLEIIEALGASASAQLSAAAEQLQQALEAPVALPAMASVEQPTREQVARGETERVEAAVAKLTEQAAALREQGGIEALAAAEVSLADFAAKVPDAAAGIVKDNSKSKKASRTALIAAAEAFAEEQTATTAKTYVDAVAKVKKEHRKTVEAERKAAAANRSGGAGGGGGGGARGGSSGGSGGGGSGGGGGGVTVIPGGGYDPTCGPSNGVRYAVHVTGGSGTAHYRYSFRWGYTQVGRTVTIYAC